MALSLLPRAASSAEEELGRTVAFAPHDRSPPADSRQQSLPPAIYSDVGRVPVTALPELGASEIAETAQHADSQWVGTTRPLPGQSGGVIWAGIEGQWYRSEGRSVWRGTVRSPGASSLRLRLADFDATGDIYLTGGRSESNVVGPYSAMGPQGDGDFWSGIILGDTVTVHYVLPVGASSPTRLPFRVTAVAHLGGLRLVGPKNGLQGDRTTPAEPVPRSIAGCHIDVSCYPDWESRSQPSVAKIVFQRGFRWYQCTGVLINPLFESDTMLLMLTAGHCLSTNAEAMDAVFTWNEQTTTCYGQPPSRYRLAQTTGARLIARRDDWSGDFALLSLSKQAVLRVSGYWSRGWTAGHIRDGTPVVAISHPDASFKRLSLGHIDPFRWSGLSESAFTGIRWRQGTSEGGASGSGVLRESDGRLVGVLIGGSTLYEPCSPNHRGAVNRLSEIYAYIQPYLESERAAMGGNVSQVEVSLGRSGETVIITASADGTYWIGDSRVTDGFRVTARNGSVYRLRLSRGGTWTATYEPMVFRVNLAESFLQVQVTSAEDGTYWIDDWLVEDGGIYVAQDGRRYRFTQTPDGNWTARFEPSQIQLLGGALSVPLTPAGDGSYQLFGVRVPARAAITHALHGTFMLRLDRGSGSWRSEPVPSGVPLAIPGLAVESLAGSGPAQFGGDGGAASLAYLAGPSDVAVDDAGNVLIADTQNHRIRMVDSTGTITTVAGTGVGGFSGDGDSAKNAQLRLPRGIAIGPDGTIFVSDSGNNRVRAIDPFGTIRTVAGGGQAVFGAEGGPALEARLANPHALAVDSQSNLLIADADNHRIRQVSSGTITTVAGTGRPGFGGDGGPAHLAGLRFPKGVAVDAAGVIFVADTGNNRLRRIARTGEISTIMGSGERAFTGDGGPAAEAGLALPRRVAVGPDGSLYVADYWNDAVRSIDRHGFVRTIAGTGEATASEDGTPARQVRLDDPLGLAVGSDGMLLVVEGGANRVLRLTPAWNLLPPVSLPSPVHVELEVDGDWARLWRTRESRHFSEGYPFQSGDHLWNWDGSKFYRLERSFFGWGSEEVEFDYVGNFDTSLSEANAGIVEAQANVGIHYYIGLGVRRDYSAALRWSRLAASQGDENAPYLLGLMYQLGRGVKTDPAKSAEWYAVGARRGDPGSQTQLGSLLLSGEGVEQDTATGVRLILSASMQDYARAQDMLGSLLEGNRGVGESPAEAFAWTRFAALAGRPDAQLRLSRYFRDGYGVERDPREAERWRRLATGRRGLTSAPAQQAFAPRAAEVLLPQLGPNAPLFNSQGSGLGPNRRPSGDAQK